MVTEKILRSCYQKDLSTEFVAKQFFVDESIVEKWYEHFDQEELKNSNWFCEGTC